MHDENIRLGGMGGEQGGMEVQNHKWFTGIDWQLVAQHQFKPPVFSKSSDKPPFEIFAKNQNSLLGDSKTDDDGTYDYFLRFQALFSDF